MTSMASGRSLGVTLAIAATVVATDQISKRVVSRELGSGDGRDRLGLVGDLITLEYGRNTGVAFGLFAGAGTVLTVLVVALTLGVAAHAWHSRGGAVGERVGLALILGGAVGNLLDRARLGYVVDFISVGAWPTFNLADAAISTGVFVLVATLLGSEPSPARDPLLRPSLAGRDDRPSPSHDHRSGVSHHG